MIWTREGRREGEMQRRRGEKGEVRVEYFSI